MPYKEFCVFFLGKLFYKSNRKLFSCVCIAWYKHSRRWENSRQLCKPSTSSRVCMTVSNSPNPSRVYIRLCKHRKRFLLLKCRSLLCDCFNSTKLMDRSGSGIYNGSPTSARHCQLLLRRFLSKILKSLSLNNSTCINMFPFSACYVKPIHLSLI